ncbi:hypothetical protein AMECASPLE_036570, partial [Ameca splendens]
MCTQKNTHTHAPNTKTYNNGYCTPTHTPHTYSIPPGPGADTPWGNQPPDPGVVPFPPGWRQADRQAPGAGVPHHAPCNHTNTPQKSHRMKHWRKATTALQGPGTPPTPHPNPRGAP